MAVDSCSLLPEAEIEVDFFMGERGDCDVSNACGSFTRQIYSLLGSSRFIKWASVVCNFTLKIELGKEEKK